MRAQPTREMINEWKRTLIRHLQSFSRAKIRVTPRAITFANLFNFLRRPFFSSLSSDSHSSRRLSKGWWRFKRSTRRSSTEWVILFTSSIRKKKLRFECFSSFTALRRTGTTHLGALSGFTAHQDYISPLQHGALMQCKLRGPSPAQTDNAFTLKRDLADGRSWILTDKHPRLYQFRSAFVRSDVVYAELLWGTTNLDVGEKKKKKKCVFLTQKGLRCHSFKPLKWVTKLQNTAIRLLFRRARECNLDASNSLRPNGSQVF